MHFFQSKASVKLCALINIFIQSRTLMHFRQHLETVGRTTQDYSSSDNIGKSW